MGLVVQSMTVVIVTQLLDCCRNSTSPSSDAQDHDGAT
jgi:hypothetical protein